MTRSRQPRGVVVIAGMLCLAGMTALAGTTHWLWGEWAEYRLNAHIEQLRKAGEPVTPADLRPKPVADQDNAAIELRAAAAAIDTKGEAWQWLEDINTTDEAIVAQPGRLKDFIAANGPVFDHVEAAVKRSGCDWQTKLATPIAAVTLPDLHHQRILGEFLRYAAISAHLDGHDGLALARVRQLLFVARMNDRQPFVIAHLVAIGLDAFAVRRDMPLADIRVDATSAREAKALINELLDEQSLRDAQRNALRGERVAALDMLTECAAGRLGSWFNVTVELGIPDPISGYLLKPLVLNDATIITDYLGAAMVAVDAADWPSFLAECPAEPRGVSPIGSILLTNVEREIAQQFRDVTCRRSAATALALRWYSAEHNGKLPAKLHELMPKYLPAVPMDPYARGERLRYRAEARQPIIYSVGRNGTDEGGSEKSLLARFPNAPRWDQEDFVTHVKPQTPATGPSTVPVSP